MVMRKIEPSVAQVLERIRRGDSPARIADDLGCDLWAVNRVLIGLRREGVIGMGRVEGCGGQ
jgi:hypothetical protein